MLWRRGSFAPRSDGYSHLHVDTAAGCGRFGRFFCSNVVIICVLFVCTFLTLQVNPIASPRFSSPALSLIFKGQTHGSRKKERKRFLEATSYCCLRIRTWETFTSPASLFSRANAMFVHWLQTDFESCNFAYERDSDRGRRSPTRQTLCKKLRTLSIKTFTIA